MSISSLGFDGHAIVIKDHTGAVKYQIAALPTGTLAQLEVKLQALLDTNVNAGGVEYVAIHVISRTPPNFVIGRFGNGKPPADWWVKFV